MAFAFRKIDVSEYENWNEVFTQAKTTIGPDRDELLEKASEMIEKDLTLLGVAAIEDKLQQGVISIFSLCCRHAFVLALNIRTFTISNLFFFFMYIHIRFQSV